MHEAKKQWAAERFDKLPAASKAVVNEIAAALRAKDKPTAEKILREFAEVHRPLRWEIIALKDISIIRSGMPLAVYHTY